MLARGQQLNTKNLAWILLIRFTFWSSLNFLIKEDTTSTTLPGHFTWVRPEMWSSVKLCVSIGMYWVLLYVLVCMVLYSVVCIGLYWHGMYYGMCWHVLLLVCIECIGMYWYVFKGHMVKYWHVLISVDMYQKNSMYCTYLYVLVCICMYWSVLTCVGFMVCIGMYSMYWSVFACICM